MPTRIKKRNLVMYLGNKHIRPYFSLVIDGERVVLCHDTQVSRFNYQIFSLVVEGKGSKTLPRNPQTHIYKYLYKDTYTHVCVCVCVCVCTQTVSVRMHLQNLVHYKAKMREIYDKKTLLRQLSKCAKNILSGK